MDGMSVSARLRRVAHRFAPAPTLERLAAEAAAAHGLEPASVLREAREILASYDGRLPPVAELAAEWGLAPGELEAAMSRAHDPD